MQGLKILPDLVLQASQSTRRAFDLNISVMRGQACDQVRTISAQSRGDQSDTTVICKGYTVPARLQETNTDGNC